MTTIGFIGVGEIASAIVDGLRSEQANGPAPGPATSSPVIVLSPRSTDRSAGLAARYEAVEVEQSNQEVIDRSDLIVLSVLPGQVAEVLADLDVPADRTLISAVAGVAVDVLSELLPHGPRIVRVIPLPAVRERRGVTAVFPADETVEALFAELGGTVVAATEVLFSTLSATTATMSAHFAYLEVITDWLITQGWSRTDAEAIVRGQFVGLGSTLAETDTPVSELVAAHETPGGLNAQLRSTWMDDGNRARLAAALTAVLDRVTG
ncbi:pyrroline-5-carboxylate reductase [Brevibacterium ammoniilyticum]|uniref:Pyrroline-5-carboxylate reductase n=1 Tax=Brevibacterium ammoniilyticum TaxID=1046555 RepID=A0ABP9TZV8_9MICO